MCFRLWSALAVAGVFLLPGCASRSVPPGRAVGAKPAASSASSTAARSSAEANDYSSAAVEARVEAHARYTAAVLAELDDEHQTAAENYYLAAVADPTDETVVMEAAGRLLRQKQTERAIEVLKKCASRAGSSASVHARLGLAYSVAGRKELALQASQEAIRRDPTRFEGYQYLAQLHLQGDRKADGLKVLDDAFRQTKADAEFLTDLGEAYLAFNRNNPQDAIKAKALESFNRAAALKPSNPGLLQRLGDGLGQLGATEASIDAYNQLLEKVPHLTFIRDRLIELHLRRQEKDKAAEHLRQSLRESPANPQAQYLLGSIYFEDKKLAEAEDCFRKTVLLNADFEPAYYDLAAVLIGLEQPRRALEVLDKARKKFAENFVAEYYSGLAYSSLKDYAGAFRHFTGAEVIARATATNRLTHTFYFQLGAAAERNQKFTEAERFFRKSLALSPDFAEALNYLGYMWADRGENLDEARAMIEKAVRLEPKNAAFLDSLGWVCYKQNQPAEALKWIQQSVEHSEQPDATLFDHLGDIHLKLNQPEQARAAWKKSLEIERNPEVAKKLEKLGPATPRSAVGNPGDDAVR